MKHISKSALLAGAAPLRARGLTSPVRADASSAKNILDAMNKTFEEFKAERTKELDDINKRLGDVVQTEKVDRINAEISDLVKALDDIKKVQAAMVAGGGAGSEVSAEKKAHSDAFARWFRSGGEPTNMRELEVNAKLATQSDADGGYLVPEEMESAIDRVLGTVSVMRSRARVMQIGADAYKKLVNQGGATSGWVGETESRAETNTPTLREIAIYAQEIYANPFSTQKALDDSRIDIAAWLAEEVSIEFAEEEGAAFISGTGINRPRGILSYTKVANASYTWGSTGYIASGAAADFATVSASVSPADALIDLYFALKQGYRNGAEWIMSDPTMAKVRKFKDNDGAFIWSPPSAAAEVPTILQKPVYTDDNMDAVGAGTYPIAFGNWNRAYLVVDRAGIRVLRDPYTSKRVGGGVVNFEALKLLKIGAS